MEEHVQGKTTEKYEVHYYGYVYESWDFLAADIRAMASGKVPLTLEQRAEVERFCRGRNLEEALEQRGRLVAYGNADVEQAANIIRLLLLAESLDARSEKL